MLVKRLLDDLISKIILGSNCDGHDRLELLFSKKVFPVLVLSLEFIIGALYCGFLLLKFANFFFENLHFLSLFHSASDSTFPVL